MFTSLLAVILAVSTPCPTEDSTNCRYDAATMGNGLGSSFIAVGTENDYTLYYETGVITKSPLAF